VHGLVFADAHLNHGNVAINDLKGKQLATATSDNGVFELDDVSLPADFDVVATGGTLAGKALTGSLKLDVRGFQPKQYLYVNEATTLAADYQATHPTQTDAEVDNTVRNFLGLPSSLTLGAGLARPIAQFSHAKFAQAALAGGGIDKYEAHLVSQLDRGDRVKFPATAANDPEQSAAMFIAKGLLSGVLSGAGQQSFNKIMQAAGLLPEDVSGYLQTMNSEIQDLDTQLSDQLSTNEYSTVHGDLTTENAIQVAASRLSDEHTLTDPDTIAKDKNDVECYGLLLAGETQLPAGLSCAGIDTGGTYLKLLQVMDGSDSDTPLPKAFDAAWKANHSQYFYSATDANALASQFDVWKSLMSSQLAVITEALTEAGSAYSTDLTEIATATQSRLCDNMGPPNGVACATGQTIGTVAQYAPPTFPSGVFIETANDTMWVEGGNDGYAVDTYGDWGTFVDDVNGSLSDASNAFATFDASTGATVSQQLVGWSLPSKPEVNALFGPWSGTTPGQWLDGQTGQVDHDLLGQWDGMKIWTSNYQCLYPDGSSGDGSTPCPSEYSAHLVWKLDSGLFKAKRDTHSEAALIVRSTSGDPTWTPLDW